MELVTVDEPETETGAEVVFTVEVVRDIIAAVVVLGAIDTNVPARGVVVGALVVFGGTLIATLKVLLLYAAVFAIRLFNICWVVIAGLDTPVLTLANCTVTLGICNDCILFSDVLTAVENPWEGLAFGVLVAVDAAVFTGCFGPKTTLAGWVAGVPWEGLAFEVLFGVDAAMFTGCLGAAVPWAGVLLGVVLGVDAATLVGCEVAGVPWAGLTLGMFGVDVAMFTILVPHADADVLVVEEIAGLVVEELLGVDAAMLAPCFGAAFPWVDFAVLLLWLDVDAGFEVGALVAAVLAAFSAACILSNWW